MRRSFAQNLIASITVVVAESAARRARVRGFENTLNLRRGRLNSSDAFSAFDARYRNGLLFEAGHSVLRLGITRGGCAPKPLQRLRLVLRETASAMLVIIANGELRG